MLGREGRVIVPGVGGLVSAGQADERGLDGVAVAAGHAGVERLAAVPQDEGAQRLGQRAPAVAVPVVQPHGVVFEIAGQREFAVFSFAWHKRNTTSPAAFQHISKIAIVFPNFLCYDK